MTKKQIDLFLTQNYKYLCDYYRTSLRKKKIKIEPEFMVSEFYEFVLTYKNLTNILPLSRRFIYQQIFWYLKNPKYSIISKYIINKGDDIDFDKMENIITIENLDEDIILYNVDDVIGDYIRELNLNDKTIFNMVYYKHIDTAKKVSNHLNISISYSYALLKHYSLMENDLEEYIKRRYLNEER